MVNMQHLTRSPATPLQCLVKIITARSKFEYAAFYASTMAAVQAADAWLGDEPAKVTVQVLV